MTRRNPYPWLCLATLAILALVALRPADAPSPANAAVPTVPTESFWRVGADGLLLVTLPTETPTRTPTPKPPTATPFPSPTNWPKCPQASGECVWPWPSPTVPAPRTATPLPICSTPVPGLHCAVATRTPTPRSAT